MITEEDKDKLIATLTLQLQEKDKEIEYYKSWFADDDYGNHNQDKISFAVEQIVKIKEKLIKFLQDEGFYENEWYDLFDKIDNQIEELKKESNNEEM